jgi:hypothetical protein
VLPGQFYLTLQETGIDEYGSGDGVMINRENPKELGENPILLSLRPVVLNGGHAVFLRGHR